MALKDGFGLVCAYRIDDAGMASPLSEAEASQPYSGPGWTWLHFDLDDPPAREWFANVEDLDRNIASVMISHGTRPRYEHGPDGFLLILRGVNLNPGKDPEDMVSLRLWMEPKRVISTRRDSVLAIRAIRETYERGAGPATPGQFLIQLGNGLVERMSSVIDELQDGIDSVEENISRKVAETQRGKLLALRSRTIQLRRYLAPQREALTDLLTTELTLFNEYERGSMRLVADRISRYVEDLDAVRDRAAAAHEEISAQLSEDMNKTMFRLTIVATIFLPLSLLTGLLGINVGGIPGVDDPWAFWVVTIGIIAMGIGALWLMKKFDMI